MAPGPAETAAARVRERLPGSVTTDFGAPGAIGEWDREPAAAPELERGRRLLRTAWRMLEEQVAAAPAELTKGPRGGGRDRDRLRDHVLGADVEYARRLGLPALAAMASGPAVDQLRELVWDALGAPAPRAEPRRWSQRYYLRRACWHVLDHLWELQDRTP